MSLVLARQPQLYQGREAMLILSGEWQDLVLNDKDTSGEKMTKWLQHIKDFLVNHPALSLTSDGENFKQRRKRKHVWKHGFICIPTRTMEDRQILIHMWKGQLKRSGSCYRRRFTIHIYRSQEKNFEEETIVHEQLKLMFPLCADAMIEELLRLTKK